MSGFNYCALICGGLGDNVWDKTITFTAADFMDAAGIAKAKADELYGQVVEVSQDDWSVAESQAKRIAELEAQNEKFLKIIYSTYQVCGVHDVSEHILDVLCAPESATDEMVEAMLPYELEAAQAQAVPDAISTNPWESLLAYVLQEELS